MQAQCGGPRPCPDFQVATGKGTLGRSLPGPNCTQVISQEFLESAGILWSEGTSVLDVVVTCYRR